MGMSASQARLLSITARLSHNELESQLITNSKTRLANKTQEANKEYLRALSQEKLMYRTFDAKGNQTSVALTPSAMYTYNDIKNQYGISNASGQLLVSSLDARNYQNSHNLVEFLQCYGVTDIQDLQAQQMMVDGIRTTVNELVKNLKNGTSIIPSLDAITDSSNSPAITIGSIEKNLAMYVWGNLGGSQSVTSTDGIIINKTFADGDTSDKSLVTYSNRISKMWLEYADLSVLSRGTMNAISLNRHVLNELANFGLKTLPAFDGSDNSSTYDSSTNELAINIGSFVSNGWTFNDNTSSSGGIGINSNPAPYTLQKGNVKINLVKDNDVYYLAKFVDGFYALDGTYTLPSWNKENQASNYLVSSITYDNLNGSNSQYYLPDNDENTSTTSVDSDGNVSPADTGQLLKVGDNYYDACGRQVILRKAFRTNERGDITYENSSNYSAMFDFLNNDENSEYACVRALRQKIKDLYCQSVAYMQNEHGNSDFNLLNDSVEYTNGNRSIRYNTYNLNFDTNEGVSNTPQTLESIDEMIAAIKEIYNDFDNLSSRMSFEYKQQIGEFSGERQWYTNLWYRMNGGSDSKLTNGMQYYKELDDNLMNSDSWMQFALEHGVISLEQVKYVDETVTGATNTGSGMPNREWATLIYTNASEIVREEDEVAIARAEAKYKTLLNEIESKDKNYDNKLRRLDNEHDAIKTEYDSIKEVLNKNIDRSFKTFS